MNRQQTTLLVIPDTSSGSAFILPETHKRYSHLIAPALRRRLKTKQDWEILGRILITICQYADYSRQIDVLREASNFLASLSLNKELQSVRTEYIDGWSRGPHNRNFAQAMNPTNRINIKEPKSGSTVGGTEELSI
jgi:hypothetical protein